MAARQASTGRRQFARPWSPIQGFFHRSLVDAVPRDHRQPDHEFRRRQLIGAVTLLVGAVLLGLALHVRPGDPMFYPLTLGVALAYALGALASGPLHLGWAHDRTGRQVRPVVAPLLLGLVLLALFLAGAAVVVRVPGLRDPVEHLLDHARLGSLPVVAAVTASTGFTEEMFFHGALYAAVGRRFPVLVTTVAYTLVTAVSGVALLVLAGALVSFVTGLQRRVTGGVLAPILTHLTWSMGMLFLLPVAFNLWS
jgi:membrane protease YdiL (CAAX protease family)